MQGLITLSIMLLFIIVIELGVLIFFGWMNLKNETEKRLHSITELLKGGRPIMVPTFGAIAEEPRKETPGDQKNNNGNYL